MMKTGVGIREDRARYKCPLCGSPLTEDHYHRVIKLQEKKEKVRKGELDKLRKQVEAAGANKGVRPLNFLHHTGRNKGVSGPSTP